MCVCETEYATEYVIANICMPMNIINYMDIKIFNVMPTQYEAHLEIHVHVYMYV